MVLFCLSLAIALSVAFLSSLVEAVLLSLTPAQLADINTRNPALGAVWRRFKSNIEQPIAVILILNTAAHTIGAAVAGAQFDEIAGEGWIWVFSLAFTYAMLQFTEILPKTLGVRFNRSLVAVITRPLEVLVAILRPVIRLVHLVNRPFEPAWVKREPTSAVSLEDLTAMAGLARLAKLIGTHQERIIRGASRLSHLKADEVMVPAEQITLLSTSQSTGEALVAAHLDPHTRFPVCEENDRDRIVGYVNFKELVAYMRTNPNAPNLRGIIRPVKFVPPQQPVGELLASFVEEHSHIALIRSESGRTLGLITLEDIVEELLGKLEDEFDHPPRMLHALAGGTWMIGGGVPLSEVNEKLGLNLEGAKEDLSTWLIRYLGHVPKPGETCRVNGMEIMARRTRRGKVFEVVIVFPSTKQ